MKKTILFLFLASLFFFNCKSDSKNNSTLVNEDKIDSVPEVPEAQPLNSHNSQNSLDWQGTYKGTTPCADCEGIETEIVLNYNLTFSIKTKYLGKGDGQIFEEKGTFTWDKTGSTIILKDVKERPSQYKVGENRLIQLDMDGNTIAGNLAEKYVLTK